MQGRCPQDAGLDQEWGWSDRQALSWGLPTLQEESSGATFSSLPVELVQRYKGLSYQKRISDSRPSSAPP